MVALDIRFTTYVARLDPRETVANFLRDLNLSILLNLVVTLMATWLCVHYEIDMGTELTGIITPLFVFPLAFSVNAAYQRRQDALNHFAGLKANLWALYHYHTKWIGMLRRDGLMDINPGRTPASEDEVFIVIQDLLGDIRWYCTERLASATRSKSLEQVYAGFRKMQGQNNLISCAATKAGYDFNDVCTFNAMRSALEQFEEVRTTRDYTTPRATRSYFKIVGQVFPIILAPSYVEMSRSSNFWEAYFVATVVSTTIGVLMSAQEQLNNPFNTIDKSLDGSVSAVASHPDNIDLSKLVYWPTLAMGPSLVGHRPQSTIKGGPTPMSREILRQIANASRIKIGGPTEKTSKDLQNRLLQYDVINVDAYRDNTVPSPDRKRNQQVDNGYERDDESGDETQHHLTVAQSDAVAALNNQLSLPRTGSSSSLHRNAPKPPRVHVGRFSIDDEMTSDDSMPPELRQLFYDRTPAVTQALLDHDTTDSAPEPTEEDDGFQANVKRSISGDPNWTRFSVTKQTKPNVQNQNDHESVCLVDAPLKHTTTSHVGDTAIVRRIPSTCSIDGVRPDSVERTIGRFVTRTTAPHSDSISEV